MIPKLAIERAIEEGWRPKQDPRDFHYGQYKTIQDIEMEDYIGTVCLWWEKRPDGGGVCSRLSWERIALDPSFWQALGKALGWNAGEIKDGICEICGEPMPPGEEMFKYHGYSSNCPKPPIEITLWKEQAQEFYDLILTGGDTEKFWEELLK